MIPRPPLLMVAYALLFAVACTSPDFVTKRGAGVWFDDGVEHNWSKETADEMEDWGSLVFSRHYAADDAEISWCIAGTEIDIQRGNDYMGARRPGGQCEWYNPGRAVGQMCWGYYSVWTDDITLSYRACEGRYVYLHELIHLLQWCHGLEIDADHSDPVWEEVYDVEDLLSAEHGCDPK